MSTVIGILDKEKNRTLMVADTLCSNGDQKSHRKNPKVFYLDNQELLIGCVGNYRLFQILQYHCNFEELSTAQKRMDPLEYLVTFFVPFCIDEFERNKLDWSNKDNPVGNVLIASGNRLFKYEIQNGQVGEYDLGYYAIGSGSAYALGSLHTTEEFKLTIPIEDRLKYALNASKSFDKSTDIEDISNLTIHEYPWEV